MEYSEYIFFSNKNDAEKNYIDYVNQLLEKEGIKPLKKANKFNGILTSIEFENVYKIAFNRPNKLNALNGEVNCQIFFVNLKRIKF